MKGFLLLAALFALAVPAAYAVPPGAQDEDAATASPSQVCKGYRRTMGVADFRSLYAPTSSPKVAFDVCVAKLSVQVATDAKNAAKACVAERAENPDAFMTRYGKPGNGSKANAFGKCVSMTARGLTEAAQEATLDAAATCKSERQQMGVLDFKAKYGTNVSKSNAFGKCVKKNKKPTQS